MVDAALYSTGRDDRPTPPEVIDLLLEFNPDGIALDPCSNPDAIVPARCRVMLPSYQGAGPVVQYQTLFYEPPAPIVVYGDGLALNWAGLASANRPGMVYVNHPYSKQASPAAWMGKCALEHAKAPDLDIVALSASRTDTAAFHASAQTCTAQCFVEGRIQFLNCGTGAPFPSLFTYWGPNVERFGALFSRIGTVRLGAFRDGKQRMILD